MALLAAIANRIEATESNPNFLLNSSGQSLKLLAYGRLTCTRQIRGSNALRGEGCLAGARRSDPVAFMVTGSESCPAINGGTMRARIMALSLALALVVVGIVSAEESGNWFTRLFTSPSPDKKVDIDSAKVKDGKGESTPMPPSARAIRTKQATADKERRDAVCIKLRDLALCAWRRRDVSQGGATRAPRWRCLFRDA